MESRFVLNEKLYLKKLLLKLLLKLLNKYLEPFSVHRGMGLVSQIFNEPIMMTLKGNLGIGHTRYSTMGGADNVQLAQPFIVHTSYGTIGNNFDFFC
jgi:glutamine phosphoribosylpyrophosphate amidotransferase